MGDGSVSPGSEPKAAYGVLFVTLLVYFVANPLVDEGGFINLALNLMIIAALMNALRTVAQDWRIVALAVLLGVGVLAERPMLFVGVPLRVVFSL